MMNSLIIFGAKYLLFLVALLVVIWFFRQPKKLRQEIFLFAVIVLPLTYAVAKISSLLYHDARPFVVGNFTPLLPHAPDNGFPSDHTLLAGALAAIVFFYNKKNGVIFFLLAFLVGASRVLAGVHHWLDIFGSLVIALVVAYLIKKLVMTFLLETRIYKKYFV